MGPYRRGLVQLQREFVNLIVEGHNTVFAVIDRDCARQAAELRARYNLLLPDALQVATALRQGCDALLTNDVALRRVSELTVLLVSELEV